MDCGGLQVDPHTPASARKDPSRWLFTHTKNPTQHPSTSIAAATKNSTSQKLSELSKVATGSTSGLARWLGCVEVQSSWSRVGPSALLVTSWRGCCAGGAGGGTKGAFPASLAVVGSPGLALSIGLFTEGRGNRQCGGRVGATNIFVGCWQWAHHACCWPMQTPPPLADSTIHQIQLLYDAWSSTKKAVKEVPISRRAALVADFLKELDVPTAAVDREGALIGFVVRAAATSTPPPATPPHPTHALQAPPAGPLSAPLLQDMWEVYMRVTDEALCSLPEGHLQALTQAHAVAGTLPAATVVRRACCASDVPFSRCASAEAIDRIGCASQLQPSAADATRLVDRMVSLAAAGDCRGDWTPGGLAALASRAMNRVLQTLAATAEVCVWLDALAAALLPPVAAAARWNAAVLLVCGVAQVKSGVAGEQAVVDAMMPLLVEDHPRLLGISPAFMLGTLPFPLYLLTDSRVLPTDFDPCSGSDPSLLAIAACMWSPGTASTLLHRACERMLVFRFTGSVMTRPNDVAWQIKCMEEGV